MLPEFRRSAGAAGASKKAWPLGRVNARSVVYQALLAAAVGLAGWYLIANAVENVLARRIASGFGFLWREAGFEIGETTFLSYNAGDTYLRALAVGLLNTFRVRAGDFLFDHLVCSLAWRGYRLTGCSRSLPKGTSK
jgi:ABC-type amino acid transport system permease subunit